MSLHYAAYGWRKARTSSASAAIRSPAACHVVTDALQPPRFADQGRRVQVSPTWPSERYAALTVSS